MARPKQQLDLPEGWQDEVLALYESGASDVEIKAHIRKLRGSLSNDLWGRWLAEEPEFSDTIKSGRELSEIWWLKLGRAGAAGKIAVNPTLWIFNMKNRFNWADKREMTSTVTHKVEAKDLTDDELANIARTGGTGVAATEGTPSKPTDLH